MYVRENECGPSEEAQREYELEGDGVIRAA
jgi:hypothetical protein